MNRSDETLFDPRIANWLEDDPNTAPDEALDVVLAAFPSIKQRRTWRVPWRVPDMSPLSKFAAMAAAVAVVVVGAYLLLPRLENSIGAPPTASPSQSPSPGATQPPTPALLNTSSWVEYASDRYGFSIAHPTDWRQVPALRDWTIENDAEAWTSDATESFLNPQGSVKVSAWSVPVAPGATVEAWMEEWCRATSPQPASCSGIADRAFAVETKDGHPGLGLVVPDKDPATYFLDGETIYVVAVWRGVADPEVRPYGGARALLEAYISTLTLPAAAPDQLPTATPASSASLSASFEGGAGPTMTPSLFGTSSWVTYESSQYGFTLGYPGDWAVQPAQGTWDLDTDAVDVQSTAMENFTSPEGDVRASAWSVPFDYPDGQESYSQVETWVGRYCLERGSASCNGTLVNATHLCVELRDCHPGLLLGSDQGEAQAFFSGGYFPGQMVVVTVWRGEHHPSVVRFGGARRLLEALLFTMGVISNRPDTCERAGGENRICLQPTLVPTPPPF